MNIWSWNNSSFLFVQKIIVFVLLFVMLFTNIPSTLNITFLPKIEKAEAATGDFSIFRETTGTETVSTNTLDVSWDTTVQSSANIALQSNNSDISLTDGGKYLVLYNVWTEQGTSTSGTNRRSQRTWLTVGGVESKYGIGGGYLRDSDGTLYMYNSGSAIIDSTAGDNLQVHVQRDDTNTTAGVNVRPDTNGISVLKLKDTWDYLRIYKTASSSDIDGNTTFTDVTWDTSDEVDTGSFAFTPTSGAITLKGTDQSHFLVTVNVKLNKTANNTRENYEMRLTLDGVEIPGTRVTSYVRGDINSNGILNDTLVYTGIIKKDAVGDQTLNVEYRRESSASGGVTVIVGDQTALSIAALPDEASYIMLTNDSNTSVAASRTGFGWNTQQEVDSYAFSHSTTTASSSVNIDRAGDYLFFNTMYATNVSNDRQPPRIDWRKNGGTLLKYASHGSYIRGSQTFSGGSSAGLIMDNLTASDYIEITHFDETGTPVDSAFQGNRVAVQGVLLDDNFFGLDVIASATGTHAIDTDIPTTNVYAGGGFVIKEQTASRNITNIAITESGTVDAQNGLNNIKLFYDLDTTGADGYDCSSESYDGTESQYGATDTNGFSGADGVSSFSDSVAISTTQSMCVYVVYDVTASSTDGDTVQISIADPSTDISGSGSPSIGPVLSIAPSASTTLRNAEVTQTNYNWRNDDGSETTATSVEGTENTPAIGFANGTIRRLRLGVSAEGSTSSTPIGYRLEYAQKTTALCVDATGWTDVGTGGGGDWDVVTTANLTDGSDTTNIALQSNGGITDPAGGTFLTPNGGQKDTSSQTGNITFTSGQFTELEYAIEPTVGAPQGNTYCFRLTDAGTPLRNYTNYPEGTISADIDVSASSSQVSSLNVGTVGQYVGGTFVIERPGSSRTLTDITITETGTVDAQANLANPTLFYDLDITAPYDCTGESYNGTETSVTGSSFSGPNGTSTFTGLGVTVRNTQSFCGYIVFDVGTGAQNGDTINIEITDPSSDVVVTSSTVGPSAVVSPTGSTTINGPVLTQTGYHWRNDDGSESGATSATTGNENTSLLDVPKLATQRVRLQVSNGGAVSSQSTAFRLEYGTKVTTCDAISSWTDVGGTGGAFDMVDTTNLTDGNDTTNIATSIGGITDANTTFLTPNGGQKDTSSQTGGLTFSSTNFTELEYAIEATADAGDETNYCFRVTDAGTPLPSYTTYAELTTRPKQDFYIQRGTVDVTGTGVTLVAGTDYTAPASTSLAFIRITNSAFTGAGDTSAGGTQNADDVTAYISNPSNIGTSVNITRPSTAASSTRVNWEIIEYIGINGADNEMKVRDVGTVTYGATALSATGTAVTGVADDSDVVVFITGQLNPDAGTANYNDGLSTASWSTTTQQPVFSRADADSLSVQLSYAVVEFTGANWKVQRVEHQYAAAGTVETENITAVNSLNTTFLHTQKRVGNGLSGLDEFGQQVWLSSVGALSFQLRSGANTPADQTAVVWVIENTQSGNGAMNVYRSNGTIASGGTEPESNVISIGGTIRPLNASLWITNDSSGTGTAYPRPILGATILNTTQYELWNSDTGQNQDYHNEVVEWPVAEISMRQNYYRFYVDNDALDPTDPWPVGASDLGENTSITGADDPLGEGERVRIRMSVLINNAALPAAVQSYKLQYGKRDVSCSAITTWTDLGDPGSATVWRGYNTSVSDGTELATSTPAAGTLNISVSDVAGTFEESNPTAVNPYAVDIGQDIEYDWVVEHNGAAQLSDYCFRMVQSDGTLLDGYNYYPTLRTTGYTPVVANWRWYDDETNLTPVTPLANENITPINIADQNGLKLRVTASEVEGAPGSNIKFKLQYSESADFSTGVYDVTASSSCTATSTWCYIDAAGVDNAIIDSGVLSDSDACSGGAGNGCGTYNEAATTISTLSQSSLSNMEFEFALKPAAPRVNAVYYFRLYDVTNDVSVSASSSYPSVQIEGASLVFTVTGLDTGITTEGVVLDATSTATTLAFGSVPFDTEFETAQRLTVQTNATEGYQVLMFSDQNPTNTYGTTIAGIPATNASPLGWVASGCAATTTGCFGYHAGDDLLKNGDVRFAANDSYAAVSATPAEIMYKSTPANESYDMVYKIQVGQEQPSGNYQSTVTYIAVPVF